MKAAPSAKSPKELSLLVVGTSPLAAALTEALAEAGQDVEGTTFEHAAAASTAVAPDMVIVCGQGSVKDDRKVLTAVGESGLEARLVLVAPRGTPPPKGVVLLSSDLAADALAQRVLALSQPGSSAVSLPVPTAAERAKPAAAAAPVVAAPAAAAPAPAKVEPAKKAKSATIMHAGPAPVAAPIQAAPAPAAEAAAKPAPAPAATAAAAPAAERARKTTPDPAAAPQAAAVERSRKPTPNLAGAKALAKAAPAAASNAFAKTLIAAAPTPAAAAAPAAPPTPAAPAAQKPLPSVLDNPPAKPAKRHQTLMGIPSPFQGMSDAEIAAMAAPSPSVAATPPAAAAPAPVRVSLPAAPPAKATPIGQPAAKKPEPAKVEPAKVEPAKPATQPAAANSAKRTMMAFGPTANAAPAPAASAARAEPSPPAKPANDELEVFDALFDRDEEQVALVRKRDRSNTPLLVPADRTTAPPIVDVEIDHDTIPPRAPAKAAAAAVGVDEEDSQVVDFGADNPSWDPNADTLRPPRGRARTPDPSKPAAETPAELVARLSAARATSSSQLAAAPPAISSTYRAPAVGPTWMQRVAKTPRAVLAGGAALGVVLALVAVFSQGEPSGEAASPEQARKVAGDLLASAGHSTDSVPVAEPVKSTPAAVAAAPVAPALVPPPAAKSPAPAPAPTQPAAAVPAQPAPAPAAAPAPAVDDGEEEDEAKPADPRQPERDAKTEQARVLIRQGTAYKNLGKLDQAEAMYKKALALLPRYPLAVANLVRLELQRKNAASALRWAKMLVAMQANRGANQLLLGDAYAASGRMGDARQAWQRAKQYGNATARARLSGK